LNWITHALDRLVDQIVSEMLFVHQQLQNILTGLNFWCNQRVGAVFLFTTVIILFKFIIFLISLLSIVCQHSLHYALHSCAG
jgi:hypothetical protein